MSGRSGRDSTSCNPPPRTSTARLPDAVERAAADDDRRRLHSPRLTRTSRRSRCSFGSTNAAFDSSNAVFESPNAEIRLTARATARSACAFGGGGREFAGDARWIRSLEAVFLRLASRFARVTPGNRRHAGAFLRLVRHFGAPTQLNPASECGFRGNIC